MTVKWVDYKKRQQRLLDDITSGDCTLSCAAAINVEGNCHCRCNGANHGAIWIEDIVVEFTGE